MKKIVIAHDAFEEFQNDRHVIDQKKKKNYSKNAGTKRRQQEMTVIAHCTSR